jgi:urease accessory protein
MFLLQYVSWHNFLCRRKLKHMQDKKQDEVRELMSGQLRPPTSGGSRYAMRSQAQQPPLIASCSPFGRAVRSRSSFFLVVPQIITVLVLPNNSFSIVPFPQGAGTVAGLAAADTESIYAFLKHHLAGTRAVPWRFALPFVMKLTDRLRHSTGLR